MQKRSELDFFRLCRRFAILFDSCTDLLLMSDSHEENDEEKSPPPSQPRPLKI